MGKFQVYNASAGSGKTYTLVRNYLAICLGSSNPMKFREILAITFTNKAANEMKERIVARLQEMATFKEGSGQADELMLDLSQELKISPQKLAYRAADALGAILHNYSAFSVSTIDKFTNRLIRSFAHDLNLNGNYEVELDNGEMLEEAIDRMLADLEEGGFNARLLLEYINGKLEDGKSPRPEMNLRSMGYNLFDESAIPYLKRLKGMEPSEIIEAGRNLKKEAAAIHTRIKTEGDQLLKLIQKQGLGKEDFSRGTVFNYLLKTQARKSKDWLPNKTVLDVVDGASFYTKARAGELAVRFEPIESELRSGLASLTQLVLEVYPRYHLIDKVVKDVYSLATLSEMERQLEAVKQESNRLPIGEFNKLISEKLDREPAAYIFEKLGDRYHYFFVDEFQDTSFLQWKNLLPLISNAMASSGSVMIVGDGKQSIYRWRGGDVSQFLALSDGTDPSNKILVNGQLKELYQRQSMKLGYNYRSREQIVNFNNDFFALNAELLEGEQYKNLYQEADQIPKGRPGGYVSIQRLEYDPDTYEQQQCELCLKIVKEALQRGYQLNDISLITRRKQEGSLLATYLIDQGLAVLSPDSLVLGGSEEVKVLVSFLKVLLRPDDHNVRWDLLLKVWELNPPSGFADRHAFLEKLIHMNSQDLHGWFEAHIPGYQLSEILGLSLLDKVYRLAQLLQLDLQKDIFVHSFIDRLADYQSRKTEGEAGFIRWWDEKGQELSVGLPEGNQAIKVMTVHKSKGLEFPITIVPFTDWLATSEPGGSAVWMDLEGHDLEGLPVARVGLSADEQAEPSYREMHSRNQENVYLDNLNLAYVAFTRAMDELYILGSKSKPRENQNITRYISNYFDHKEIDNNGIVIGELTTKARQEEIKEAEEESASYEMTSWQQRLKISIDAPLNWKDGESMATSYGKKVHSIMAQIRDASQAQHVLERNLQTGMISKEDFKELSLVIGGLTSDPVLSKYFEADAEVRNEGEILLPNHSTIRPDRVVIQNGMTHIIDYKTGEQKPDHQGQLNDYRKYLNQMGYPPGDNVLIYLKEQPEVLKW